MRSKKCWTKKGKPNKHILDRLQKIDEEIEQLKAEKICWTRHLALCEMMVRAKEADKGGILCTLETLIGSSFENAEQMKDSLYCKLFREKSFFINYFRLCSLYPQDGIQNDLLSYRQAYLAPLSLLPREDLLRINHIVHIPQQECIVAYCPNGSIIDEENAEESKRNVYAVYSQTKQLLDVFRRELAGDVLAMTVTISNDYHEALLFIPVKPLEN